MMTSATFASVEFVALRRPIPILFPANTVAGVAAERDWSPFVRSLDAPHVARVVVVIAGIFTDRLLAPL